VERIKQAGCTHVVFDAVIGEQDVRKAVADLERPSLRNRPQIGVMCDRPGLPWRELGQISVIDHVLDKPVHEAQLAGFLLGSLATAAARQPPIHTPEGLRGLQILLVEDNEVNQKVMNLMLARLQLRADLAATGRQAVDAVLSKGYDVVLMDVHTPEMDGLEATREIRGKYPDGKPYIIAVTASVMADELEKCRAAGMDDYLTKPLKPDDLLNAMMRYLEGSSSWGPTRTIMPQRTEPKAAESGGVAKAPCAVDTSVLDQFDRDVVAELVSIFETELKQFLAEMRSQVAAGDREGLSKSAHSLKGPALMFGAARLGDLCDSLERTTGGAARDQHWLDETVRRIEAEAVEITGELQAIKIGSRK